MPVVIVNDAQIDVVEILKNINNNKKEPTTMKEVITIENYEDTMTNNPENPNNVKLAESKNELFELTLYQKGIDFQISPKMLEILKQTEELTEKASILIKNATPENVDEETLDFLQEEMKEVKKYDKAIETALKEVSKTFDKAKKEQMDKLQTLLNSARYNEMQDLIAQLNNIKKYITNQRYINNWQEIFEYYHTYLSNFPHLYKYLPNLISQDKLQQKYPKLSNRSKTWKLNDKIKSQINEYVAKIEENYQIIKMQNSPFEGELLSYYNNTENITETLEYNMKKLAQQARDEELKRKLEEEERLRKEKEKELAKLQKEREEQQKKLEEERKKQLQIQKEQEALLKIANAQNKDPNKTSNLPFGVSEEQVTPETYNNVLKLYQIEDLTQLDQNGKLMLIKEILNTMYDPNENKELLQIIKSPQEALSLVHWISK